MMRRRSSYLENSKCFCLKPCIGFFHSTLFMWALIYVVKIYYERMTERLYKKLLVWQQAHALCIEMYKLTKQFPDVERWRLTDQLCRASASVPANIAEGNVRPSAKEKIRFIDIAYGSLDELHYHCLLAKDLSYITDLQFQDIDNKISSISYLLSRLKTSLSHKD